MKKILYVVGFLVAAFVITGLIAPRVTYLEREIVIDADISVISPQLTNLHNFVDNWSPWTSRDPEMTQEFEGAGVGSVYRWSGDPDVVGTGTMTIVSEIPGGIHTRMEFEGQGGGFVDMTVTETPDGNVVKWTFEEDQGFNLMARIFGLMMDGFLGADYEEGLNNLKTHCEKAS